MRAAICARCGRVRRIRGRRLCAACFVYQSRLGNLADWPRVNNLLADVADDFRTLRGRGLTLEQIAGQLRYKNTATFADALVRAHRAGHLAKADLPAGMWAARDTRRRNEGAPLQPREVALLEHYAAEAVPQPCEVFGLKPTSLRTYKHTIRRKLGVGTWNDAVAAFATKARP